jgi:uncharacterized protein YndB with AHSA1/START domain
VIDQTQTRVLVERSIDVPAAALFAVLADPARHAEIDGSGTVKAQVGTPLITEVGQVFTMAMSAPDLGEYRSENHVIAFEAGLRIAWETTRDGKPPPGFYWSWDLEPLDASRTRVVHVYDWERIEDPAILARVSFPRVTPAAMSATVNRLAAVAAIG